MAGKMRQGLGCGLDVIGCGTGIVVRAGHSLSHSILRGRLGSGIDVIEGAVEISEYLYRLRELELMYDGKFLIMVQERVKWPKKIGRNELCSCGSGKKYKRCHGR